MPLYFVNYDMVNESKGFDYSPLTHAIKKIGGVKTQWSAWLVENAASQLAVYKHLKPLIDSDDRLMVVLISQRPSWSTGFAGTKALIDKHFPA